MSAVGLDPLIHQQARMRIMAMLARNRQVAATELRDHLGLTAGNLASHVQKLEDAGYVKSGRVLVDLSFEVHVRITEQGHAAFMAYLDALESMLGEMRGASAHLEDAAHPDPPK